jgi:molybdopterin-guanine dinucleotide biosynthesis protein A
MALEHAVAAIPSLAREAGAGGEVESPPPTRRQAVSGSSPDAVAAPLWGGVLIGGASRRMGEPKQLLRFRGRTLLETATAALAPHVAGLALLGAGSVPAAAADLPRVADSPLPESDGGQPTGDARERASAGDGPLAGLLAALRWRPDAAWVFAPCDLPWIAPDAVAWLLAQRAPARWAVLPRPLPDGPVHPLFALYEPPALTVLEELAAAGRRAPRFAAEHPRVAVIPVPPELARCWRGVATREDLGDLV